MPIRFRKICHRFRPSRLLLSAALLLSTASALAQVLARPGWAGSGVTVEPWWRHAVFYRIDPAHFQDSTGNGHGDLAGVAKRLDYLQSLGVDALILQAAPGTQLSPDGFDDLARGAVSSHLRVLVELDVPASQAAASDAAYLALARSWLNQGAAGLYVPTQKLAKVDGANHIAVLMHQLRTLTNSFPGERILMADSSADADVAASLARETQLTASAAISTEKPDAASLREQLQKTLGQTQAASANSRHTHSQTATTNPLLVASRIAAQATQEQQTALQYTVAAALLASRGAVLLEYGEEIGLVAPTKDVAPLMQWTPSNVTAKPAPPPPPPAPATTPTPEAEPAYSSFQAYIAPPQRNLFNPPHMPEIVESDNPQPVNVDPNSLPGFTAGAIDASLSATNAATANVALETEDPDSLLNFYRKLIRLRHDGAMKNGTQSFMDHDADDVLFWTRHAPAGTIVVVCNLGDKAYALDLNALHLKLVRLLAGALKEGAVPAGGVVVAETR